TLGGTFSSRVDVAGGSFVLNGSAGQSKWSTEFGASGDGPVSLKGTVKGPGPVVDATLTVYGVPVSVQGTPAKDLSIRVGLTQSAASTDAAPMAAFHPLADSESPSDVASQKLF